MEQSVTRPKLPEYDSPPAIETLMGVHFARLANWNILHFGRSHAQFRKFYPKASLLPPVLEQRDLAQGTFDVAAMPIRAIFTNADDSELVQVQSSMFLRNWKRTPATQGYIHYASLKPKFQQDWRTFQDFVRESDLKPPQVLQCEVTYVNHIVRGKEWSSYNDLAKLLKPFAPRQSVSSTGRVYGFLPEASAVSLAAGYQMTDTGVSLQVSVQSAIRSPDGSEVIQMPITAKVAPSENTESAISEALDSCHDAVILGFDDVITEAAQNMWGRHDPS
jgi:uncharacterized protein (TIGR04255 family)